MHFHVPHIHITAPEIEHGLDVIGRIAGGGAISNGAEALSNGISAVEDIRHHQYEGAVVSGADDRCRAQSRQCRRRFFADPDQSDARFGKTAADQRHSHRQPLLRPAEQSAIPHG